MFSLLSTGLTPNWCGAMNWAKETDDPPTWVIRHGGRILAQVQHNARNGNYRWHRYTSIDEHGTPPASGWCSDKQDAMKKASVGLVPAKL